MTDNQPLSMALAEWDRLSGVIEGAVRVAATAFHNDVVAAIKAGRDALANAHARLSDEDRAAQDLINRGAQLMRTSDLPHNRIATLEAEIASEQDARHRYMEALRHKDEAMNILFEQLRAAGIDCSDLIP